ncbi:MAG: DNA-3-methyladenine glycosylase I [Planctomycetota bacterium]
MPDIDKEEGRCTWAGNAEDYIAYHDEEWGMPVVEDHRLFEKLCLEGFQAGLSWLTILRKREGFRRAFADFDFERIARFNARSVEKLVKDASIIRHRGKIESTINNARQALSLRAEYGTLAAYFWSFEPRRREAPQPLPSSTEESKALSKDLKRRGFTFVGPTTAYAFMQAMGLVNDHLHACPVRLRCEGARKALGRMDRST